MRLIRWTSLALLASVVFACSDSTGPKTVQGQFVLHDINGRLLPTYPATTPGMTPIIHEGILTLEPSGRATIWEHRTEFDGRVADYTTVYNYQINGRTISFSRLEPCPPAAICAEPPTATFSLTFDQVSIKMGEWAGPILYNYRRGSVLIPVLY